jgi:glycerol 2-dehydrogenase (NADP+)
VIHITLAETKQNEDEVGQGIKDSGVPREDIFITSKVYATLEIVPNQS